jgi:hypothetical protein
VRTSSPFVIRIAVPLLVSLALATAARAQDPHAGMQHQHGASTTGGWQFMDDGAAIVMFNRQGGSRGDTEWKVPNWWMGMGQHRAGAGTFTFTLMLSLDPATVGARGYSEIFQVGETYQGDPLIDRQHPHDFLMQASGSWRLPLRGGYTLTLAGAPVGEPALGPVAFMHRLSSVDNPVAPLSHHTFDSTHIAMGVLTGSIERGPVQVESSLFNGREPDEQRWDLMDPGALDSWSVRGWYRPSPSWAVQVSHGYLTNPEASEEGDVRRTTATVSWTPRNDRGWRGVTAGWGLNNKLGGAYNALLLEGSYGLGPATFYGRAEHTQVETDVLRFGVHTALGGRKDAHVVLPGGIDFVSALTLGATRTLCRPASWEFSAGADITAYHVPSVLKPTHGAHPVSAHVYVAIRPPSMHRMTEMTMIRP